MSQKVVVPPTESRDKTKSLLKEVKTTPSNGKVSKPSLKTVANQPHKKPHRFRPGTVATREIRKYQSGAKATDLLIPQVAVQRLVKDILVEMGYPDLRLGKKARALLQLALEDETVKQMQITNEAAIHAGRITIQPKDIKHANRVRDLHPGTTFPSGGGAGVMVPTMHHETHSVTKKEKKPKRSVEEETTVDSGATTQ